MRRALCLLPLLSAVLSTTPSWATVTQPNGSIMPVDSANGEVQLYTLFNNLGEGLDYQTDGTTTPSVFSPLCDFKATLVLNQAGSSFGVGWYNVDPNASTPPTLADIQVIVPAGSPVGTVVTSADIKSNPAYQGGLIGFALVGGQTHYSEPKWNPMCTGCTPPGPWVTAVIYASKKTPNAFYMAFEDGQVGPNPGNFNNDGDYNDYVYFFTGLTCSGGGQPCDTGKPGVCAAGITQCGSQGVTCQQLSPAAASETCDGLDNDCNGTTDDVPGKGIPCVLPGGCPGVLDCQIGVGLVCVAAATSPEVCNGIDDDCDGSIDEEPEVSQNDNKLGVDCDVPAAPADKPPCKPGKTVCKLGAVVCEGAVKPGPSCWCWWAPRSSAAWPRCGTGW